MESLASPRMFGAALQLRLAQNDSPKHRTIGVHFIRYSALVEKLIE